MKVRNWFWGIFFLLCAVFILLNQLGFWITLNPLVIIFTVILINIVLKSIRRLNFYGILIPIALLLDIYNLTSFSFSSLVLIALFTSIGLSIIFRRRHHHVGRHYGHYQNYEYGNYDETFEEVDENIVVCRTSLGADTKYLRSSNLETAQLSCTMGSLKVYFDQAGLSPGGAQAVLDVTMGSIELFIPRNWHVIDQTSAIIGSVTHNPYPGSGDGPTLTLNGSIQIGGVTVHYI